jgi:hypothetical protein
MPRIEGPEVTIPRVPLPLLHIVALSLSQSTLMLRFYPSRQNCVSNYYNYRRWLAESMSHYSAVEVHDRYTIPKPCFNRINLGF